MTEDRWATGPEGEPAYQWVHDWVRRLLAAPDADDLGEARRTSEPSTVAEALKGLEVPDGPVLQRTIELCSEVQACLNAQPMDADGVRTAVRSIGRLWGVPR